MGSHLLGTRAKREKEVFMGRIKNGAYIFYLCIVNGNTLPSLVPVLGR